jgi:flagellar basal-body rod protein FlgF
MIRSVYEAASAMMAQMARQLTISNNLSNVSTPGYREETLAVEDFREMYLNRISPDGDVSAVGGLSTAVRMERTGINLAQGALMETGNILDLAIAGGAFFAVQTPAGATEYTRNGQFKLNNDRQIVTNDGALVLGENGPITVPAGEIFVDADGSVRVDGETVARLQLTEFAEGAEFTAVGNSRYTVAGEGVASEASGVSQGFLEGSNVDIGQAQVDMMAASRSYQMAQRMMQLSDQSLALAVNDIGKVG